MLNQNVPTLALGLDLLQYGHDYLHIGQSADSPFQYLFMGAEGTQSTLHRDTGGLSILLAPVIGRKEVVLVHRYVLP